MDWDFNNILWPTVYLLLACAIGLTIWAILLRAKAPADRGWREVLLVAAFCLAASLLMIAVHSIGYELSLVARLGIVTVILFLYAYYSYRRNKS